MPSQIDFDSPPTYDILIDERRDNYLSPLWIGYIASFYQTLISYLSQNGIFIPNLTTLERNQLTNLVNGQFIYNITVDAPQFWQASSSSWRTVTYT